MDTSDSDIGFSSSQLKAVESALDSPAPSSPPAPTPSSPPANLFSPSIRINLPSYAAFSSTPNLSSPSWQKIPSTNGEQSFSFSFELDNSSSKNEEEPSCLENACSAENQMLFIKGKEDHCNIAEGASYSVPLSPSADSGIELSLRSVQCHDQSSTLGSSFNLSNVKGTGTLQPVTPSSLLQPQGPVPSCSSSSSSDLQHPSCSSSSSDLQHPQEGSTSIEDRPSCSSVVVPMETSSQTAADSMPNHRSALSQVTNTAHTTKHPSANVTSSPSSHSQKGKRKCSKQVGSENKKAHIFSLD